MDKKILILGGGIGGLVVANQLRRDLSKKNEVIIVDAEKKIIFKDKPALSYNFLVGVPSHGLPPVLENSPILGESGWIKVNPKTLTSDVESVYAFGDVTSILLPVGKPLPKAGVFAHYQADAVAEQIEAKIKRTHPDKEFEGKGGCTIELGDGRAGYASGKFYTEPEPVVKLRKPSRLWHWRRN